MMNFKRIPFAEIEDRYKIKIQDYSGELYFDNIPNADYIWKDDPNVFSVFEGKTQLSELNVTLINDYYFKENNAEHRAVLVVGDLIVDHNLNLCNFSDVGMPRYLFVTGDVKAKSIMIGGYVEMMVLGNVEVNELILSAKIKIKGNLTAKNVFVNYPHLKVLGETRTEHFFVQTYNYGELIENFNLNEDNYHLDISPVPEIIQCPEQGIQYFPDLPLLNSEEFEDFTELKQEEILNKAFENRIFKDDFYTELDELEFDKISKTLRNGQSVFKNIIK